jgi:hypothetical protein
MLAFIYLAYSMMALLYETVPAFEDTWIELSSDDGLPSLSKALSQPRIPATAPQEERIPATAP